MKELPERRLGFQDRRALTESEGKETPISDGGMMAYTAGDLGGEHATLFDETFVAFAAFDGDPASHPARMNELMTLLSAAVLASGDH